LAIFDAQESITIQRELLAELKYYDSDILKNVIARMKSRVPQESNPTVVTGLRAGQSRIAPAGTPALPTEIVSPVLQRGRNDILWPPVTEALARPGFGNLSKTGHSGIRPENL
jgi:hypothetical protein